MRVDAHHHLWRYDAREFDWIDESMALLKRDFLPAEFEQVAGSGGIDRSIVVQARQTVEETRWLLDIAAQSRVIGGVVGWLPIAAADFPGVLEEFAAKPMLKGLRHVVQGEPDGFLDGSAFNRGVTAMLGTGLTYDLLIVERQLLEAIRFVDRHPKQVFVVDHFAKPDIRSGTFAAWSSAMRRLAERQHVAVKLSGLVTEADWQTWTPALLRPYFDVVLEAFTPARLMFGSDWPVMTVAATYQQWSDVVDDFAGQLTAAERDLIGGSVADRIYRLSEETTTDKDDGRATT